MLLAVTGRVQSARPVELMRQWAVEREENNYVCIPRFLFLPFLQGARI